MDIEVSSVAMQGSKVLSSSNRGGLGISAGLCLQVTLLMAMSWFWGGQKSPGQPRPDPQASARVSYMWAWTQATKKPWEVEAHFF